MKMADMHDASSLSDHALLGGLERLVNRDRKLDAELLRYLGEVDRRRLYREQACSSMFAFCTERLAMSEDAAYKRIRVARAARALPVMLEHLESGKVHLSGLSVLASHITADNAKSVLARAAGKSKRRIEELARELAPLPDLAASIRKTPTRPRPPAREGSSNMAPGPANALLLAAPERPARMAPLAPARYHVSFTASAELKNNIAKAKELAGHGARVEDLFERAMELLVSKLAKDRFGARGRDRRRPPGSPLGKSPEDKSQGTKNPRGRYLAKAIRREVFDRDGGQCTFVDASGRRCSERCGLHFDHLVPHAQGGESTAENLRLLCGPHPKGTSVGRNQLHAEECFGALFMAERRGLPPPATV